MMKDQNMVCPYCFRDFEMSEERDGVMVYWHSSEGVDAHMSATVKA
jgi:hypothetical protein